MAMDFKLRRRFIGTDFGAGVVVVAGDGCLTDFADVLVGACFALLDLFSFAKKSLVINCELLNNGMYVP